MKNKLSIVLAVLFLLIAIVPMVSAELVLHYSFDDCTVTDLSGKGNIGINNGAACVDGGINNTKAMSFDGASSYISTLYNPNLNGITDAITIEAWIYPRAFKSGWLSGIAHMSECWSFRLRENKFNVLLPYPQGTATSITTFSANRWYHVAATYDKSMVKLYVNGVLEAQAPASVKISTTSEPMDIGRDATDDTRVFDGLIDGIAIYNNALSAAEIQQHYSNVGFLPLCSVGETKCSDDNKGIMGCVGGLWTTNKTCASTEECKMVGTQAQCIAKTVTTTCTAGQTRCYQNNIQKCSSDGTKWENYQSCDYGCETVAGSPKCKAKPATTTGGTTTIPLLGSLGALAGAGILIIILLIIIPLTSLILWIICLVHILKSGNDSGWKTLWALIVTFLGLIGMLVYLIVGKKSRIAPTATATHSTTVTSGPPPPPGLKKAVPKKVQAPQAIIDYIKAARARGMKDNEIRKALIGSGWPSDQVDAGFSA